MQRNASPRSDVAGARVVHPGERVACTVTGARPGERLEVSPAPTMSRGGNCCGVMVRGAQADEDGVAKLRFRWPRTYDNGADAVRSKPGATADVIACGEGGSRITVVRVKRRWERGASPAAAATRPRATRTLARGTGPA